MRAAFETGAVNNVSWIPGYYMVADALTKDDRTTAAFLNKILCEGRYPAHPDQITRMSTKGDVLESARV